MRRSLLGTAMPAAALAVALSVTGCDGSTGSSSGSTTTGSGTATTTASATSGAAASDDVAWVDKVCGEVVELMDAQTAQPPNLADQDAQKVLQSFGDYLDQNIAAVESTINDLERVGPSPISGGDEARTSLTNGLESFGKSYQTIKNKFSSINPNDSQAAQAAVMEAFNAISQGADDLGRALSAIEDNPEIKDAAAKAPNCQKLELGVTSTTSTPTTTS